MAIARRLDRIERLPHALKDRVHWIQLDLFDHGAVSRFIKSEQPSALFHLAGSIGLGSDRVKAATICQKLNVDATVHLLKASNEAGTQRIIIIGSAEEYGNQTGPFDQMSLLKPTSPYGITKAEATRVALTMHDQEDFPVVVVRPFSVYGPQQPRGMFVSDAISAAVRSEQFSMSEGTQQRDLVFVGDVVAALIDAARTPGIEGMAFNLGSGNPVRLCDVARMIWRISGTGATLLIGGRSRSDNDMQMTWADPSLARTHLGWEPRVDLESGLRITIEWTRAHGSST